MLRNIDLNVVQANDVSKLEQMATEDFMVVQKKEQCKYKSFCMDIAQQAGYIVTGHDRFLQIFTLSTCERVIEKKIESASRKSGSMDQIRVLVDSNAGVVISSSTDKFVTIYEAATGNVICRTTCGEITTAMCLSTNCKHLITSSSDGVVYVWRLPEGLQKAFQVLKQEQRKKEQLLITEGEGDRGVSLATDIHNQQLLGLAGKQDDEFNALEGLGEQSFAAQPERKVNIPGVDVTANKHDPVRVSEVLAQISKAAGKIDQIQMISKKQQAEEEKSGSALGAEQDEEEEFDFGMGLNKKNSSPDSQDAGPESNSSNQKKNRVNWGNRNRAQGAGG